jgi:hypothetical protein
MKLIGTLLFIIILIKDVDNNPLVPVDLSLSYNKNFLDYGNLFYQLSRYSRLDNSEKLYEKCEDFNLPYDQCPNLCRSDPCRDIPNAKDFSCKIIENNKRKALSNTCKKIFDSHLQTQEIIIEDFNCLLSNNFSRNFHRYIDQTNAVNIYVTRWPVAMYLLQNTDYKCSCYPSYTWNQRDHSCTQNFTFICDNVNCNDHGSCNTSTGKCKCLPAWRGDSCELENNPCDDSIDVCNGLICIRYESTVYGYTCICPQGYSVNEKTPNCDDINECEIMSVCSNNSTCINTNGSFKCDCKSGYYGDYCQHKDDSIKVINYSQWADWLPWEPCDIDCGIGHRQSVRECNKIESSYNDCVGPFSRTSICVNAFYCYEQKKDAYDDYEEFI